MRRDIVIELVAEVGAVVKSGQNENNQKESPRSIVDKLAAIIRRLSAHRSRIQHVL